MSELIEHLSQIRGISSEYTDAWGKPAEVLDSTKSKLLAAMGYPINSENELIEALNFEAETQWQMPLNPVTILRQDEACLIELRISIDYANCLFNWLMTTEQGNVFSGNMTPIDHDLSNVTHINDKEYQAYTVLIDLNDLPLGYHQLSFTSAEGDFICQQSVIIAPHACYKPAAINEGKKTWGPSVQLYCLRSEHNWGIGDFADLRYLIEQLAQRGADFVGLNPIHALYPSNPDACSPYSPSSRRWLNPLYIDVQQIKGFEQAKVQNWIKTSAFQAKLQQAKTVTDVDYNLVAELKFSTLALIYQWFEKKATKKLKTELAHFIEQGGDSLQQIATFDAIQQMLSEQGTHAWGWPAWPEALQDFESEAVTDFIDNNREKIHFYCYLQWIAQTQLHQCQQVALEQGMAIGIYRDLAVGVSEGSAEIWANPDLYCKDASVGAPADVLGPQGQNWGLPPMDPEELFEQGFQPFIDLLQANMQDCGALRIDHVMALLRLWWVPKGETAKEGAYVYYPVDELLALLALESHRNQCLVIGEDLGTVPDGIQALLAENAVHSYRVFFFETAEDGGFISPSHYPEQAMATLTTHDMATLKGFWRCDDLVLGKAVGIYPDDDVLKTLYDNRHADKQRILDSLAGHHLLTDDISQNVDYCDMTASLNKAMHIHMATGSCSLLCLQLEDWLQMEKPVNIPGTSTEYPNWRRKLTKNLSEMFNEPTINGLLSAITNARNAA